MSNRELVIEAVDRLPKDMPLLEMVRELRRTFGIEEQPNTISSEEARRMLKEWDTEAF